MGTRKDQYKQSVIMKDSIFQPKPENKDPQSLFLDYRVYFDFTLRRNYFLIEMNLYSSMLKAKKVELGAAEGEIRDNSCCLDSIRAGNYFPEGQKKGLGKWIMDFLISYMKDNQQLLKINNYIIENPEQGWDFYKHYFSKYHQIDIGDQQTRDIVIPFQNLQEMPHLYLGDVTDEVSIRTKLSKQQVEDSLKKLIEHEKIVGISPK